MRCHVWWRAALHGAASEEVQEALPVPGRNAARTHIEETRMITWGSQGRD